MLIDIKDTFASDYIAAFGASLGYLPRRESPAQFMQRLITQRLVNEYVANQESLAHELVRAQSTATRDALSKELAVAVTVDAVKI